MELKDFLKSKQVRFIGKDNRLDLTNGKVYDVIGVAHRELKCTPTTVVTVGMIWIVSS